MAKRIITISREFGSGGRFIGGEVAEKLGMKYYDKDIIAQIADFILKDRDDVLNVFIHGDVPKKVKRICRLYHVTETDAVKMMADIDKRRMTNYRFYTEQKWGMAGNYSLTLNSSQLGYDNCEKIIMMCAK